MLALCVCTKHRQVVPDLNCDSCTHTTIKPLYIQTLIPFPWEETACLNLFIFLLVVQVISCSWACFLNPAYLSVICSLLERAMSKMQIGI